MSDVQVPPPAINVWDLEAITTAALSVLRLRNDDIDEARIRSAATAATELLDHELDAIDPTDATLVAALGEAAAQVAVALYGGVGDPIAAVRPMALPWKRRWGVA